MTDEIRSRSPFVFFLYRRSRRPFKLSVSIPRSAPWCLSVRLFASWWRSEPESESPTAKRGAAVVAAGRNIKELEMIFKKLFLDFSVFSAKST